MTGLQISAIIFVLAMMATAFAIATWILYKATEKERLASKRIGLIFNRKAQEEKKKRAVKVEGKNGKKEFVVKQGVLQKLADAIFDELLAANIIMKPEEFAMIWIGLTFAPALLATIFAKNPLLPGVLAIVGAVLPIMYVKRKQGKRLKAFESQLSDALIICSNCLRSGLTFTQAMETIAKQMEDPIGTEFKRTVSEMNFGSSMDEALNSMVDRVKSQDFMLVVAAVSVQRQTGGNLSEILNVISETIRDRIKIKADVRTMTSQGRASGTLIGVLPIGIALILSVINPDYMMMFINTKSGNIMLIISGVLEVFGFIAINKVVDIKY